jgi:hypothetical protein
MSAIEDSLKNLETAIAELKAALQAEQIISSPDSQKPGEQVTNQGELTIEQINEAISVRF